MDVEPLQALALARHRHEAGRGAILIDRMHGEADAEGPAEAGRAPDHFPSRLPDDLRLVAVHGRRVGFGAAFVIGEGAIEGERGDPAALAVAAADPDGRLTKAPVPVLAVDEA